MAITAIAHRPPYRFFLSISAAKNVAEEVIDLLLASVRKNLLGTRTATLTSVHQTVKAAMRESIVKLLTPKKCGTPVCYVAASPIVRP